MLRKKREAGRIAALKSSEKITLETMTTIQAIPVEVAIGRAI